jgi:3-oxoacyl-[acyl-carrier protein] reductase
MDPLAVYRLDERLAVVTGAASGIGLETARFYAAMGATVVMADIDGRMLAARAAEIGNRAHAFAADLSAPQALERLARFAASIAPIDIWANVAGTAGLFDLVDAEPDAYARIVRINMDGTYWGCAAAARALGTRGGTIINVSSNAADQPMAGLSVYAMTKAAVNMLTRSLAVELGPKQIRVNAVAPGFILTGMTGQARMTADKLEETLRRNAARSPIGATGEPADIAHAMLYLASDASRYVTGQILRVNGGATMPG